MPGVVHFEIHADNPERAVEFYKKVFSWKVEKWQGPMDYWLIDTGEVESGINGAITRRQHPLCGNDGIVAYLCTVNVDSVDEYSEKVKSNGGKIIVEKQAIPGIGWYVQCMDTEGNMFGLMEDDTSAK